MAIQGTNPGRLSTTGVKYLNMDKGYKYVARAAIKGKHFVVWQGYNYSVGEKVAKKIQELMMKSEAVFLDWYDYEREEWLKELKDNGY